MYLVCLSKILQNPLVFPKVIRPPIYEKDSNSDTTPSKDGYQSPSVCSPEVVSPDTFTNSLFKFSKGQYPSPKKKHL